MSALGSGRADLAAALAHTQPRDMLLVRLLDAHQVLSTPQICSLLFSSLRVCQRRLDRLRTLGLVDSFFRRDRFGRRQPARWMLGRLGMRMGAVANGDPLPTDRSVQARRDRIVASPTLDHRLAVNQFFVDLIVYARARPGLRLVRWWPEEYAAGLVRGVVPDGYGAWQVGATVRQWFLELDTGTEDLPRLVKKMAAYDHAARLVGRRWLVLWRLPSPTREDNLHRLLAGHNGLCPMATTAPIPDGPGPGGPVWRVVGGGPRRVALDQLGEPADQVQGCWSDEYTDR